CVLVINKVDRLKDKSALLPYIAEATRERSFVEVFPVSALRGSGLEELQRGLLALLPEGPPLYGEDELTDRSERFLAGELVREQSMRPLGQERPDACSAEAGAVGPTGELRRIG